MITNDELRKDINELRNERKNFEILQEQLIGKLKQCRSKIQDLSAQGEEAYRERYIKQSIQDFAILRSQ